MLFTKKNGVTIIDYLNTLPLPRSLKTKFLSFILTIIHEMKRISSYLKEKVRLYNYRKNNI